jgi:hypothetical protein
MYVDSDEMSFLAGVAGRLAALGNGYRGRLQGLCARRCISTGLAGARRDRCWLGDLLYSQFSVMKRHKSASLPWK